MGSLLIRIAVVLVLVLCAGYLLAWSFGTI